MSEREVKTIQNIDYLGRTDDVVEMDPLNLGASSRNQNVIDNPDYPDAARPRPTFLRLLSL